MCESRTDGEHWRIYQLLQSRSEASLAALYLQEHQEAISRGEGTAAVVSEQDIDRVVAKLRAPRFEQ